METPNIPSVSGVERRVRPVSPSVYLSLSSGGDEDFLRLMNVKHDIKLNEI